ncbi:hypothetical protein HPC49_45060 [Pyxidicoccus fallax]|uniref:PBP domain-containing protein n=1 Tax=Pyxidicoccus fallax TaxID=394095 RepID=A0A848LT37_9BACT|nr:hypothetical protein [Pyxidicoccus fallax]NMO20839.1 hypothetical protein [Pyxidicoccus fallax]NPC85352.1 hypothetical protein [Pyxidicoccus fallax]
MSRVQWLLVLLLCGLVLIPPRPSRGAEVVEFVVITHPLTGVESITRERLSHYFLKKETRWTSGVEVQPVDLPEESAVRASFSEEVLQRSVQAVRAWWQQRIFSGRGLPPETRASDAEVVQFVRDTPGAVGYVSAGTDVRGVQVLVVEDP